MDVLVGHNALLLTRGLNMETFYKIYIIALAVLGVLAFTFGFQPAYASSAIGADGIYTTLTDYGFVANVTELDGHTGYTVTVAGTGVPRDVFLVAFGATAGAMAVDGSYGDVSTVGVVTSEHTGFVYVLTEEEAQNVAASYIKGDTFNLGIYGLAAYNNAMPMTF